MAEKPQQAYTSAQIADALALGLMLVGCGLIVVITLAIYWPRIKAFFY